MAPDPMGPYEFALYDAAVQLERGIAALTYVVNECGGDLDKYCAAVPAGEHDKKLTKNCKGALASIGLE